MNKKLIIPIILGILAVPAYMLAQGSNPFAEPCLIRVYNTNFAFPPEGGKIVQTNEGLFFARTYLPGCQNAIDPSVVVSSTASPANTTQVSTPVTQTTPSNGLVNFLIGDPCLIAVYHTDFMFPPEGGAVIKIGNSLYFVPTYLPNCASAINLGTVVRRSTDVNPPIVTSPNTGGGTLLNFLIGDPCLVPIYTRDFAFPPEGGKIVTKGNQMYFAKTYVAGCENAGS